MKTSTAVTENRGTEFVNLLRKPMFSFYEEDAGFMNLPGSLEYPIKLDTNLCRLVGRLVIIIFDF